jgi:hypothetical protein
VGQVCTPTPQVLTVSLPADGSTLAGRAIDWRGQPADGGAALARPGDDDAWSSFAIFREPCGGSERGACQQLPALHRFSGEMRHRRSPQRGEGEKWRARG